MTALALKLIACLSMLLDHIGYTWPAFFPLRAAGRLAFPLFVFFMVQGFRHTSSRGRYALRLGVFAVLSQVPFSLLLYGEVFYPNGNVLWTLLLSLLCLWQLDALKKRGLELSGLLVAAALLLLFWVGPLRTDYGPKGILLALTFYYFADRPLLLFFGMFFSIFHQQLLHWGKLALLPALGRPAAFDAPGEWTVYQLYALLSFGLIRIYNGRPGPAPASRLGRKAVQLGFYAFYPVHMLALWLLKSVIR